MKTWAKIILLFDTSKQKRQFLFDISKQSTITGMYVKQNKRRTFELLHGRDLFKTSALDSGYWF
jgi:hypothetical protein